MATLFVCCLQLSTLLFTLTVAALHVSKLRLYKRSRRARRTAGTRSLTSSVIFVCSYIITSCCLIVQADVERALYFAGVMYSDGA